MLSREYRDTRKAGNRHLVKVSERFGLATLMQGTTEKTQQQRTQREAVVPTQDAKWHLQTKADIAQSGRNRRGEGRGSEVLEKKAACGAV